VKTVLKWLAMAVAALVAVVAAAAAVVVVVSNRHINRRYDPPAVAVTAATDSAALARGEHLARAVTKCVDCHGANLAGGPFIDAPPFARIWAPNLTAGRGGKGATYSDADFARAIVEGVRGDGRSAAIMPAKAYRYLSPSDLAAIIGYVRSMPPVDTTWPDRSFGPISRTLVTLGKLPIFQAEGADLTRADVPAAPAEDTTAAYGEYLARIGGCQECHNPAMSGGPIAGGDPDSPPAANLSLFGSGAWPESTLVNALRHGKRIGGGPDLDARFMPWRASGLMTDAEIHAIYLYLRSLPVREVGQQ